MQIRRTNLFAQCGLSFNNFYASRNSSNVAVLGCVDLKRITANIIIITIFIIMISMASKRSAAI